MTKDEFMPSVLDRWRYFYGASKGRLREKLAAPGVTSYLMGGCANQIFQYATGPALAIATERAILDAGERSVFVHVRRTDYVGNPYHVVLPMDYYREAAALIAAKVHDPVFFIFSDDPEWCEANFKLPYHTTIAGNFDRTVEHHLGREDAELYLMRQCGHAIMANSSYSWWGAWLGADIKGGIVIAPKSWIGPAFKDDARDIVSARWMRL